MNHGQVAAFGLHELLTSYGSHIEDQAHLAQNCLRDQPGTEETPPSTVDPRAERPRVEPVRVTASATHAEEAPVADARCWSVESATHAEEAPVAARAWALAMTREARRAARSTVDGPSTERSWAPTDGAPTIAANTAEIRDPAGNVYATISGPTETIAAIRRFQRHREAGAADDSSGTNTRRHKARHSVPPQDDAALATAVAFGSAIRPDVLQCVLQLAAAQPRASIPGLDSGASYLTGPPRGGRPVTPEQLDAETDLD